MLESVRNFLSGKTLIVVVIFLALPFVLLGTASLSLGTFVFAPYGTVNGLPVKEVDLSSANGQIASRFKSLFGEDFELDTLPEDQLRELVRNQIINQKLIQSKAIDAGLSINSDQAKKQIMKMDEFKSSENVFDETIFETLIRSSGMTPNDYIELFSLSSAAENLIQGLTRSYFLLDNELVDFVLALETSRDIDFIKTDFNKVVASQDATLVEGQEFYNENNLLFLSEEKRKFGYAEISNSVLMESIIIDEDVLYAAYEDYQADITSAQQNRISHIMIDVSNYSSALEAKERMVEIASDISIGKFSFEEAVQNFSEDADSIPDNGDLGYSSGDAFPEEFELIIDELQVNQISEIIELKDESFHIIKLTEVLKEQVLTYDEKRSELLDEIKLMEASDQLNELLNQAEDKILSGANLTEVVVGLPTEQQETDLVDQDSVLELFQNLDSDNLFSSEYPIGRLEIFDTQNGFMLIEVLEIQSSEVLPFETVADLAIEEVRKEKARLMIASGDELSRKVLIGGEGLDLPDGFKRDNYRGVTRFSSILPPNITQEVFNSDLDNFFSTLGSDGENYFVLVKSESTPPIEDVQEKLEEYKEYFKQHSSQKISLLLDDKLKEDLIVKLQNLDPAD